LKERQNGIPIPCLGHHCGRMEVQHKETETGCLPRNEEIRKKERDKDKELMKEGLSAGDV